MGLIGHTEADLNALPMLLMSKRLCMRGVTMGGVETFNKMNRMIGAIKLRPCIDKVFAFEDAKKAYEYMEGQAHVGKVVIQVSRDQ